jgi:hypothetical protein
LEGKCQQFGVVGALVVEQDSVVVIEVVLYVAAAEIAAFQEKERGGATGSGPGSDPQEE